MAWLRMSEKLKFAVETPLEYNVECSEKQWDSHIISGHPIMIGNEQTVIDALKNPLAVYRSGSHPKRHAYFGTTENASYGKKIPYTKVIVDNSKEKLEYDTITAFPSKKIDGNIDGGELLYVSSKPRPEK